MIKHGIGVWLAAAVVWAATAAPARAQEQAPPLPSDDEVRGKLTETADRKIEANVAYWINRIKNTEDLEKIRTCREVLVNGYQRYPDSAYFQLDYARIASAALVKLIAQADPAKQVQAALAIEAMPQVTIQPALEEMAKTPNAGVQYWAIRGYGASAKMLIAQGDPFAATMLATLERLGCGERTNGPALAVLFRALNPWPEIKKEDAARLRKVLDQVWLERLRDVLADDPDVIDAYRRAVRSLTSAAVVEEEKPVQRLLLEVLDAASAALVTKQGLEDPGVPPLIGLLAEAETRLAAMTQQEAKPALRALMDDKQTFDVRVTTARLAVNDVWKKLLKDKGVTARPLPAARAADSQPAPRPATGTAPAKPAPATTPK